MRRRRLKRCSTCHSSQLLFVVLSALLLVLVSTSAYLLSSCNKGQVVPTFYKKDGRQQGEELSSNVDRCSQVVHMAVVCAGNEAAARVVTLIKSVLFHRKNPLVFHLIVDSDMSKRTLTVLFETWHLPSVDVSIYVSTEMEKLVSWIPNSHYSGVYGLLKLTLPELLPKNLEKVIVVDTDVLFVSDVFELWQKVFDFAESQAIGLVENLSNWYLGKLWKRRKPWPALGCGFNTGVILMDLSKLRRQKWTGLWQKIAHIELATFDSTPLADQDIFNAVLKRNVHLLYTLPCEWNFQLGYRTKVELCRRTAEQIKVVHWNSPSKTKVKTRHASYFRKYYETFQDMDGALLKRELLDCITAVDNQTAAAASVLMMVDKSDSTCQHTRVVCNTNFKFETTGHVYYDDVGKTVETSGRAESDDDECHAIRKAGSLKFRTHVYYRPVQYNVKAADLTLVTQLSMDRLQLFFRLLAQWDGPVSVAIYASDAQVAAFSAILRQSHISSSRLGSVAFHIVYREGIFYPVNYLRNVALNHSLTEFVFLTDVDFLPMFGAYDTLRQAIVSQGSMEKKALILAAFESPKFSFHFPRSKAELINHWDASALHAFRGFPLRHDVWSKGHVTTDYDKWRTATAAYVVSWSNDYEPYVVLAKTPLLPSYDTRFLGFGWNKVSHIMQLDALGYELVVLANAFMVHLPHTASLDVEQYRQSPVYRNCLKLLKGEFIKDLSKNRRLLHYPTTRA